MTLSIALPIRSEKSIKTSVLKRLKREFPDAFILKISDFYTSGLPDILMVDFGFYIFIELKTVKGKLSTIQTKIHDRLRRAGAIVIVSRDPGDCINQVQKIREEAQCRPS